MAKQQTAKSKALYQKPTVLNAEAHRTLKFKAVADYKHTAHMGSALLLGHEFMMVAKEYPIVFVKSENDNWDAVSMLSLKGDQNLFVGKNGEWLGQYVPAVMRRYPFILSQAEGQEDYTVCFDEASSCFEGDSGNPLFDAEGKQTKTLQNIIHFLNEFQRNYQVTQNFIAKLNELELLKDIEGTFTIKDGEKFKLTGMWVVDEEKLSKLDEKTVNELFKSGYLAWIQFHVMSLSNLTPLANRFANSQGLKVA